MLLASDHKVPHMRGCHSLLDILYHVVNEKSVKFSHKGVPQGSI